MTDMPRAGPDPTVSNEEIVAAIKQHDLPAANATQCAELVGLSRQRCRERLNRLVQAGVLNMGVLGENQRIYWPSGD